MAALMADTDAPVSTKQVTDVSFTFARIMRLGEINEVVVQTPGERSAPLNHIPHGVFWITHTCLGQILPAPL